MKQDDEVRRPDVVGDVVTRDIRTLIDLIDKCTLIDTLRSYRPDRLTFKTLARPRRILASASALALEAVRFTRHSVPSCMVLNSAVKVNM